MKSIFGGKKKSSNKSDDLSKKLIRTGNEDQKKVELNRQQFKRDLKKEKAINASKGINQSEDVSATPRDTQNAPFSTESEKIRDGYKWDFCIVVPNPDACNFDSGKENNRETSMEHHVTIEEILERLHLGGLETYSFFSSDSNEILIKLRANLERLMDHADQIGFRMLLDEHYIEKYIDDRDSPIGDDPAITRLTPYEFIYAKYSQDQPLMFAKAHGYDHPFSSIIRIKLIMDIIHSDSDSCCALNLRKLSKDGSNSILSYFPLHEDTVRNELNRNWLGYRVAPWEQPIDDVKDYFGEKIALYFEFTGHYTTWLIPLSIGGLLVAIDIAVEATTIGSFNNALLTGYTIPFYCIFVSFWAQLMIEFWKRKQATKAMEWGTTKFEEEETERPEFKGIEIRSFINGQKIKYFSPMERIRRLLYSYLVISCMMLLVIGCVSLIFGMQWFINTRIRNEDDKTTGNTAVSVLSAIQIIVLNSYYTDLAITLTEQENHRTDTEYDDALIGKLFAFSFINSYASLFFIAFVKHNVGEACNGPCMVELATQLTIIFASKVTIEKISTYMTLVVNRKLKERQEQNELDTAKKRGEEVVEPSRTEKESYLEDYDPSLGTLEDYAQIFVQYGFVTLFVAACPLAPGLAYISNYIEVRSDGWKLLYMCKRPIPTGAEDIGTWLVILQMTSLIAVITNAGILCYTMDLITWSGVGTVWVFVGFQYTIFIAMAVFAWLVDDIPHYVTLQKERQEYLSNRAEMTPEDLKAHDMMRKRSGKAILASPPTFEIHSKDYGV